MYVKTTQKTKKCLGCGRGHQVSKISGGKVIKGITTAMEEVKKRQNNLAIKEFNTVPELRTDSDFCIASNLGVSYENTQKKLKKKNLEPNFDNIFKELLNKLSGMYSKFPGYMIRMLADEFKIPHLEIKILSNKFMNKGRLIPLKDNYFRLNK